MRSSSSRNAGFTLLELMIVVAIIAILAMIALPSYSDYLKRGRIVDATNQLLSYRAQMEQFYQDSRKYTTYTAGSNTFTSPCDGVASSNSTNWQFTCAPAATTYTITATGIGPMNGWVFTLDTNNVPTTTAPAGWTGSLSKFCLNKSCT